MRRTLTLILGVALFGIVAAVVVASQGGDDPAGTTDTVTETVERTTTVEDNPNRVRDDDAQGVDISGPCDEAEHANDPRCTGAATGGQTRIDNSGPGSVNSGHDDDGHDDRSGHGGGDDSGGDDHGGGGNSGPGGGGDDD